LYEVIRAGRPCHMYFDLEFNRGANPDVDGQLLVDRLVALVQVGGRGQAGAVLGDKGGSVR
jgi:hypothetical protein